MDFFLNDGFCECCGKLADLCWMPWRDSDGDLQRAVILCRPCTHPEELTDLATIQPERIFLPWDATEFSCEETDWRYLTPDMEMPAQFQHIPTSLIFNLFMHLPVNSDKFYPVRSIYAVLVHHCEGRTVPPDPELFRITREALTLWLMDAGYLPISSHTEKHFTVPLTPAIADAVAELSQAGYLGNLDDVKRLESMLGCTLLQARAILRADCAWHYDHSDSEKQPLQDAPRTL